MYSYIKGNITQIKTTHIVIENTNIGYEIYVANPFDYQINEQSTIYVYQQVREDINRLFGFKREIEKELFLKLISVTGVGPKTALNFFTKHNAEQIIEAIESGNTTVLKNVPGIGVKAANQIILDIQGKFITNEKTQQLTTNYDDEITEILVAMGYKAKNIQNVLPKIDLSEKENVELYLKAALRKMMEK